MTALNIDIHHHMVPPFYAEALRARGVDTAGLPSWTPEASLELMGSLGIDTAILSVSAPGALDAEMARAINDYGASLVQKHPGRFGAFASLPFPDVAASVREIRRALDELELDGVILLSNVDGRYVGDPEHDEILAELNARGALVLVHAADRQGIEDNLAFDPYVEYPTDIARAYARLAYSHAFDRFPRIRWVFANAGGVVPFLAERVGKLHYLKGQKIRWGRIIVDLLTNKNSGRALATKVSYDTADACSRFTLAGLGRTVEPSQIRFGSNFPYTPAAIVARNHSRLAEWVAVDRAA